MPPLKNRAIRDCPLPAEIHSTLTLTTASISKTFSSRSARRLALIQRNMMAEYERWLEAMGSSDDEECRVLALNWRQDPHLSDKTRTALGEVAMRMPAHPRTALSHVPDDAHLEDSNACRDDVPLQLSRITHAERFEKTSGLTVTKSMPTGDFLSDHTWIGMLRGSGELCWSSPSDEIKDGEGDDLRDRLGLGEMRFEPDPKRIKRNWLVEIIFPASAIPPPGDRDPGSRLYRPTCAEAGDYPPFLPSRSDSRTGKTQHLKTGDSDVTEFVHAPVKASEVILARNRGKLTKSPPRDWIFRRLGV